MNIRVSIFFLFATSSTCFAQFDPEIEKFLNRIDSINKSPLTNKAILFVVDQWGDINKLGTYPTTELNKENRLQTFLSNLDALIQNDHERYENFIYSLTAIQVASLHNIQDLKKINYFDDLKKPQTSSYPSLVYFGLSLSQGLIYEEGWETKKRSQMSSLLYNTIYFEVSPPSRYIPEFFFGAEIGYLYIGKEFKSFGGTYVEYRISGYSGYAGGISVQYMNDFYNRSMLGFKLVVNSFKLPVGVGYLFDLNSDDIIVALSFKLDYTKLFVNRYRN